MIKKTELNRHTKELLEFYHLSSRPLSLTQVLSLQASYKTTYDFRGLDGIARGNVMDKRLASLNDLQMDFVWANVFKTTKHLGLGSIAVDYFKKKQKRKNPPLHSYWPMLNTWVDHIENWVHGDMIASLYSQMLEENPKLIFPHIKKWAFSKEPWKKRMGMISLVYYFGCRDKVLEYKKMIPLVKNNLKVDHYFVQKAVGWTLRELHNAYPVETKKFINDHILLLSSYAFSAATEKIDPKTKAPWKELRKQARAKK